jgi:hypothetical protein
MMTDSNSPAARRRSLSRLLDYSLNEAQDLGLSDVAQFLVLASATLANKAKEGAAKRTRKKPSSNSVVSLAEFRGPDRATARRSSPHSTRK